MSEEKQLRAILSKVEELQTEIGEMSRDQLLELWAQCDDADPIRQYALVVALKRNYNTDAPLYASDPMTDEQRFSLQPSYVVSETEKKVRAIVERDAANAFGVMERCKFHLDEATRATYVEDRIRMEMAENGHKYWKTRTLVR